jgi:GAF domain-containing protein
MSNPDDGSKSRQQLIEELQTLRRRIGQLEAAEQRHKHAELLLRVGETTASTLDQAEIMRRIARMTAQGLGADMTGAYVPDETGNHLRVVAGYRVPPEKLSRYREYRIPLEGHAFVAQAWQNRETIWSSDVPNDPRFDEQTVRLFPAQSILVTPMIAQDRAVGVLFAVWWEKAHPFTLEERRLVEGIVRQAAMAVENARLFESSQQRVRELSFLFETSRALSGGLLQPQEIAEVLARRLVRFGNLECSFSLLEPDGNTLQILADIYLEEDGTFHHEQVDPIIPLADFPLTARVMKTLEPALVQASDPAADPAEVAYMRQYDVKTLVIFPLTVKGQAIGVMEVETFDERHFTSEQLDLMYALANQAAVALQNVTLFEQAERRARGLEAAAQVSRAASSILEMDELLTTSVDLIRDHFDLYYVGLFLLDPQANVAALQAGTGEAGRAMLAQGHKLAVGGDSMIGQCVAHKEARIALDVGLEAARFDNPLLPETRSEMALPLIARGEVIGALTVQSTQETAFSDKEVIVLQTMADQLANAIANAQQLRLIQQTRSETDKRVRELNCLNDIGQQMQQSPSVDALLAWAARRMPLAMQYPDHCVVAIEVQDRTFGVSEAKTLPWQMTQSLQAGRDVLGRIHVSYTQAHDFLDEESALLGDIARRLSGYIESSFLFQETSSRAQSLALVNRVARAVGALVDLDELMETVYQEISTIYETDAFFIALYERDRETLDFRFMVEKGERIPVGRLPLSGLTSWVVEEKTPLFIRNLEEERDNLPVPELVGSGDMAASWMGVPMLVGDQVIGVINMQSYRPNIWDEQDEQLFLTLVDQVAMAVSNTHLLENARSRAEELAVLNEMSRVLTAQLDVQTAIESLYRHASRLIDTTNFYVALYDPQTDRVSFPLAFEHGERRRWSARQAGRGLTEHVIRSGEPLLLKENVMARMEALGIEAIGQEALSWLGVPMVRGREVIGMIGVQTYTTPRLYNEHDADLLMTIANQTAIALQNARRFEQVQAALEQVQAVHRRYIRDSWQDYLHLRGRDAQLAYLYQGGRVVPQESGDLPAAAQNGSARDDDERDGPQTISLTLDLRGQSIGTLVIGPPPDGRPWSDAEVALAEAVSEQLALAIENARLFEQTQMSAQRERTLRQITERVRASVDMETLLKTAAQEMHRALGAGRVTVRLDVDSKESQPQELRSS